MLANIWLATDQAVIKKNRSLRSHNSLLRKSELNSHETHYVRTCYAGGRAPFQGA